MKQRKEPFEIAHTSLPVKWWSWKLIYDNRLAALICVEFASVPPAVLPYASLIRNSGSPRTWPFQGQSLGKIPAPSTSHMYFCTCKVFSLVAMHFTLSWFHQRSVALRCAESLACLCVRLDNMKNYMSQWAKGHLHFDVHCTVRTILIRVITELWVIARLSMSIADSLMNPMYIWIHPFCISSCICFFLN